LREQGGVVVQDHRLGVVVAHAVLGAVDLADSTDRLDGAREDVVDLAGQVHYGVVGHVVGQGASGPVVHQGGGVAGADRGADLLVVGVGGAGRHCEGVVGVVLVARVEGGLGAPTAGAESGQGGDRQAEAGEGGAAGGLHHCCLHDQGPNTSPKCFGN